MLVLQELSGDIYHKVHTFVPMTTTARLVRVHRLISFHSGPKDQVNQSNSSCSGHYNPTGEAKELMEEKDPTENINTQKQEKQVVNSLYIHHSDRTYLLGHVSVFLLFFWI